MHEKSFLEAYERLNGGQKEAVDTVEGPVMVIAGPGTGKTQILTLRIAQILRVTDARPENILALTFTESGARAMRERLATYIGAPAYRVPIFTFHEFAGKLIQQYPYAYARAVGGRPIDDLEKITLLTRILETPSIKHLRPSGNPSYYIRPILSAISEMKREYITPDTFLTHIEAQERALLVMQKVHEKGAHKGKVRGEYLDAESRLAKNRELIFVYRAYEAGLTSARQFDFDDMIFETVTALEQHEDMLRAVQETYQYVLADEHQDVNGSQNKILELIASFHDRPNLFVVGDEKQSIYRFQGASLENFLYFEEKFPHTKTIALTQNYRSYQKILDLAHELIVTEPSPAMELRIPLIAHHEGIAHIERRTFSHEAVEHAWLADTIEDMISRGISHEEIAVIVRTNREVEDIATLLRGRGIITEATADSDILTHPLMSVVRSLVRVITHPHDDRPLFEILQSSYIGLPISDMVLILRARSYVTPLSRIISDESMLRELGVTDVSKVLHLSATFMDARARMLTEAPHHVIAYVVKETGLFEYLLSRDPLEGTRVFRRIYDEVEEMVKRNRAVTLLDVDRVLLLHTEHGLSLTAPYIRVGRKAVQVMTAHKSKGLEFEYVCIPHLHDNGWGKKQRSSLFHLPINRHIDEHAFSETDDVRKLLYVAMTRAKHGLYMSVSESSTEGRTLLPTRLLEGVGGTFISECDTTSEEAQFNPISTLNVSEPVSPFDPEILRLVLRERGLSVTALNNYLTEPWNYFYRNVLRVPEVQAETAQFGTVLHETLQHVFAYRRTEGTLPHTTTLKTFIERELAKLPISVDAYTRFHEHALVALTRYLDHVQGALPPSTKEEFAIRVVLPTGIPDFPEITLTGKLDRLDFDGDGNLIRVVDYKTGKPKTRGEIEGTTKTSRGDYKRQLVFYALMLSLYNHEQYTSREGLISFIESDSRDVIHEEQFIVSDEEIELLKGDIIRVVREILNGAFLNAPCDPEVCAYAHLVKELQSRFID